MTHFKSIQMVSDHVQGYSIWVVNIHKQIKEMFSSYFTTS